MKRHFSRLLSLIKLKPFIIGMEISDFAVRLAYFDGGTWRFVGTRLEPGVLDEGKVKNYAAFVSALHSLRVQSFPKRRSKTKINTILSLSSVNMYSQVFTIPSLKGESLARAVELNMQMVSPSEFSKVYSGWQKVGEDTMYSKFEILGAFIERPIVDDIARALFDAGFLAIVIESKALALSRLFREMAADADVSRPTVLIDIDGSGIDFLILRGGQLYFEYFTAWKDIADEKGEIPVGSFETAVVRNLHQILNFYNQHWQEPIENVFISATSLMAEAEKVIRENFSLFVREFLLRAKEGAQPEWFVALGSGLRGEKPRNKDREISLLDIGAEKEFQREQIVGFLEFWRVLLPSVLVIIFISFLGVRFFLDITYRSLAAQIVVEGGGDSSKLSALHDRAHEFNTLVQLMKNVQNPRGYRYRFMERLSPLFGTFGVKIRRLNAQGFGAPISLTGSVASQKDLLAFKNALVADPLFEEVTLPLQGVILGPAGIEFSLTFRLRQ